MPRALLGLLALSAFLVWATYGAWAATAGAEQSPQGRTLIRNARLVALERPEAAARERLTVVIREGRIEAILDDAVAPLRPGDVPIDANGAFVVPGLVEWRRESPPSYAELARRPLRGVLEVMAPCGEPDMAWRATIGETSPFPAAELTCGTVVRDEPSIVPAADAADSPTTRAARAAWIIAHTSALAAEAGHADRASLLPGSHANLLLLTSDPLEDLATFNSPQQALLAGRPMRRAEVETNREFIENADRALAAEPGPLPDRRSYRIESSGLHLGRLDVSPDGSAGEEFWGPPIRTRSSWRFAERPSGWELDLRMDSSAAPRVRLSATAEGALLRVEAGVDEPEAKADATSFDLRVDEVALDPMSLSLRRREALVALALEEALPIDVVEFLPVDGQVRAGVRTVRLRRVTRAGPWELAPTDQRRLIRLEANGGVDLGWVLLDPQGWPEAAATLADAGITEFRRR